MEVFLGIVVISAVIFFGALISLGNERQRKAIDQLREQTTLWAIQDLQIKRDKMAREVEVHDPQNWLNNIAFRVCGYDLNLQIVETFSEPRALYCVSADGHYKIVFTPLSPSEIGGIRKSKYNRLGKFTGHNPLLSLPKHSASFELSSLSVGLLFDVELELVWKTLTGQKLEATTHFWLYQYT